jgi:hypothetical protein
MHGPLQPGQYVKLLERADWGIGQVQSVSGARVTVNFTHGGKVLLQTDRAAIEIVADAFEVPPDQPGIQGCAAPDGRLADADGLGKPIRIIVDTNLDPVP